MGPFLCLLFSCQGEWRPHFRKERQYASLRQQAWPRSEKLARQFRRQRYNKEGLTESSTMLLSPGMDGSLTVEERNSVTSGSSSTVALDL